MSQLSDFESWVKEILQDSSGAAFTTSEIDVALRQALLEYSTASPNQMDATLTLSQDGREVSLAELGCVNCVLEVWFPYDVNEWLHQQPAGFRFWRSDGAPTLFLNPGSCPRPRVGDRLRLRYTKEHTVQGLSGATKTSIPAIHEFLIASGAAGLAASAGAMDRSELGSVEQLRKWGMEQVKEFRRQLDELRAQSARTGGGEPWGEGWG